MNSFVSDLLGRDVVRLRVNRFQRAYNFEVLLPIVGSMPGDLVAPLLQAVTYKEYAMDDPKEMRRGAYQSFFVNDMKIPKFTMTFLETEEGLVHLYFTRWKSVMIDKDGLWASKYGSIAGGGLNALIADFTGGGYAKDIILTYFTSNGLPLREVKFRSAFPVDFYKADLSYEKNEVVKIEVTFACDMIEENIMGAELLDFGQSKVVSAFTPFKEAVGPIPANVVASAKQVAMATNPAKAPTVATAGPIAIGADLAKSVKTVNVPQVANAFKPAGVVSLGNSIAKSPVIGMVTETSGALSKQLVQQGVSAGRAITQSLPLATPMKLDYLQLKPIFSSPVGVF